MDHGSFSGALTAYEERVSPARAHFARNSWVTLVIAGELAPDRLEAFLLCYCALGVQMTAPVEGWIRRAGERCLAIGLDDLGKALIAHSHHEADHDALMVSDTHALAAQRRNAGRGTISAEALIAHPATPGIQRYIQVHEDVIAGPAPYGQIAIEYEIERLSVDYAPRFLRRCTSDLGAGVMRCLSFLEEHVALDVGHTHFNARQLGQFLELHPEAQDALVAAGSAALAAYGRFLEDCLALALDRSLFEAVSSASLAHPAPAGAAGALQQT